MKVTRHLLIELCDNFLEDKIDKLVIQNFAWKAISEDDFEWDGDKVITETLFEWDKEEINFEINKTNVRLWKNRLLTSQDELSAFKKS